MKLPSSFISSFIHLNFQYLLFLRPRRVNIIHILLITSFIYKISVALGLKVPGLVHVTESDEKNTHPILLVHSSTNTSVSFFSFLRPRRMKVIQIMLISSFIHRISMSFWSEGWSRSVSIAQIYCRIGLMKSIQPLRIIAHSSIKISMQF